MNLYSQVIFPRLLDWSMSGPVQGSYRQALLSYVKDDILEIGFGTGLNLLHYPKQVKKITVVEPNAGMGSLARKRIAKSGIQVENYVLKGESLPFADRTFDTVVSTWTLCSIQDVRKALQEVKRILKPGGSFLFVEHGLSHEPDVQVWQNRLTPLQKFISEGCHLNRDIQALVEEQGLSIVSLKRFYMEYVSSSMGYTYQGIAQKIE